MSPHTNARIVALLAVLALAACRASVQEQLNAKGIQPVYNERTGQLEQLVSDQDGDGRKETRAFMDGARIEYIEIDRNGDGAPDRWEYYRPVSGGAPGAPSLIDHAEEANGSERGITRREFYVNGTIARVVDDTNADGKPDKWETYRDGVLARVDLDLTGSGAPIQRLTYGPSGAVTAVEVDAEGTGVFRPVAAPDGGRR
jgi:hypothetical protein